MTFTLRRSVRTTPTGLFGMSARKTLEHKWSLMFMKSRLLLTKELPAVKAKISQYWFLANRELGKSSVHF